jgi:parallel beta-helix repeat protein
MHKRWGLILLAAVTTSIAFVSPAGATSLGTGNSVHCGETVTTDVVLTKNLVCTGNALVASAAGPIRIDLKGHTIKGDGTGVGVNVTSPDAHGAGTIDVSNGTITGFNEAFDQVHTFGYPIGLLTVNNMKIVDNSGWLQHNNGPGKVLIKKSSVIDSGSGGSSGDTPGVTIQDSKFVRSPITSAYESYTYIYRSKFTGSGFYGGQNSNVVAIGNTFSKCDHGILIYEVFYASNTTVEDNTFSKCGVGVSLDLGGPISVQRNVFDSNAGAGLTLTSQRPTPFSAEVADNEFLHNGGDGFYGVGPGTAAGVLRVTGNVALHNAGHGINVSGATDDGANVAHGNKLAPDCVGVTCTGH